MAAVCVEGSLKRTHYCVLPFQVTCSAALGEGAGSTGQTFDRTTTEAVTDFNLTNVTASSAKTFTIKIVQNSTTAYGVGIDTFRLNGGSTFSANWPGGSVPVVTQATGATDIYSFMTFDGGTTLYGVVGGQNFS